MRRLLSFLLGCVILLGLAGLGDVLSRRYVEGQVSEAIGSVDGRSAPPEVSIDGGLFLPQLVEGRYADVSLTARDVTVTGPEGTVLLRRVTARLTGARVPVRELLPGPLERVPADSVTAQALVAYAEVNRYAPAGVTVAAGGNGRVAVTGTVEVAGQPVAVTAVAQLVVAAGEVRLVAQEIRTAAGAVDEALTTAVAGRLDVRVPLGPLPYGLVPVAATAGADGLLLAATAAEVMLAPLQPAPTAPPAPAPAS